MWWSLSLSWLKSMARISTRRSFEPYFTTVGEVWVALLPEEAVVVNLPAQKAPSALFPSRQCVGVNLTLLQIPVHTTPRYWSLSPALLTLRQICSKYTGTSASNYLRGRSAVRWSSRPMICWISCTSDEVHGIVLSLLMIGLAQRYVVLIIQLR
jgi:hypothetical protein